MGLEIQVPCRLGAEKESGAVEARVAKREAMKLYMMRRDGAIESPKVHRQERGGVRDRLTTVDLLAKFGKVRRGEVRW